MRKEGELESWLEPTEGGFELGMDLRLADGGLGPNSSGAARVMMGRPMLRRAASGG